MYYPPALIAHENQSIKRFVDTNRIFSQKSCSSVNNVLYAEMRLHVIEKPPTLLDWRLGFH